MDKITIRQIKDKKEWEEFLAVRPEANFLQSWHWGVFHQSLGKEICRKGFYSEGRLLGVMLSVIENAKRARYLTVPGGPIIDWDNPALTEAFVKEIKIIAREENCSFVRVRPQLPSDDRSKNIFRRHGFINAPIHLHAELTSQLDLAGSEEELLAGMRKATRYEIKKANSLGISVSATDEVSAIKDFYNLQVLTSRRQKFVPFTRRFLEEQFKIFSQAKKALLYSAKIGDQLLAQAFVIFYGQEAAYHYGASAQEGRKYPGAYLIQWEAIKEARKRGMKRYNFWGVAPADQKRHRFFGVSVFKRGFGGFDLEYLHAQDLVINYPRYLINYIVEKARKYLRHV